MSNSAKKILRGWEGRPFRPANLKTGKRALPPWEGHRQRKFIMAPDVRKAAAEARRKKRQMRGKPTKRQKTELRRLAIEREAAGLPNLTRVEQTAVIRKMNRIDQSKLHSSLRRNRSVARAAYWNKKHQEGRERSAAERARLEGACDP